MTALAHRPTLLTVIQLGHWVHVLQLEVMNEATHSRIALGLPFSTSMSAGKNTCQRDKSHPSELANKQTAQTIAPLAPPPLPQFLDFEKLYSLCPPHKR